jgi:uncharacterized protein (DUF58 family)
MRIIPGRRTVLSLAAGATAAFVALVAGAPVSVVGWAAAIWAGALVAAAAVDAFVSVRAWRRSPPRLSRRLPSAFALGARKPVEVRIDSEGPVAWRSDIHDHAEASLAASDLPLRLVLPPGHRIAASYHVAPTRRGEVTFAPAEARVRSLGGFTEMLVRLGPEERRRVYPDFAQIARYAWLAGDRRLQEIGIKTYQRRGEGTDFKQLSEYRPGNSVRHIDWKATLRIGKPVVREFQDERDQTVLLLIDCGRRMRADDRSAGVGTSHFDQVLNAVMLLAYVALKQGDAVGALTFGTPPEERRSAPPRKGPQSLNVLMSALYGVQPSLTHSDYLAAAQDLLSRYGKRALVVIITNFRDEDGTELGQALRLLRSRHLVLLASLREVVVGELIAQPLTSGDAALDVASAHLYEQSRRDAFNRLAARDALMVDAVPERLGVELVNRYHAVKRAGLI